MDLESEHLPPPRGTIAIASQWRWGGRAAQKPARPAPCDARSAGSPGGGGGGGRRLLSARRRRRRAGGCS